MGCDGGTIPRRDELVRVKKKPEQKDKEAELAFKWRHCTIRQLPLQPPIVGCSLGRLYSKESVLEGLLDRNTFPESAVHIKNLKDVRNLNLTPNPAFNGDKAEKGDGYNDGGKSPYICPVIGLEMNGKYKFCFLWSCGCVMSERALKEVKSTLCHKCQQSFEETDIVILNAEDDDLDLMKERAVLRKASQKKSKKKKLDDDVPTEEKKTGEVSKKKMKKEDKIIPKLNNNHKADDPAYKKAKSDYSVAKDPKASEVFKSIFTTHKTATEQDRAHWVTYNPFYN
ncbi:protein RTF2 homolog [Temnothorax curvispinosus]|uniref:Replication termination factor 2 n=1 Tax=Temnothorax curvispinosus TaxID=300111 RepID=A0A6J1PQ51_9HYME|nr:protein RTF2 homolog [Temnothorax curvispinosus]XP_024876662.1 protein RTF2 homolog [Temnothorax curvispinosus]